MLTAKHTPQPAQALGNAALLVASGKKGCRFALPNARMMTAPPRMNRAQGPTVNMMIKANELEVMTQTYVDFLHKFTGMPPCSMLRYPWKRGR